MIIEFDQMDTTTLEHFYGGKKSVNAQMLVDEKNKIMRGRLEAGASIGLHTHEQNCEIIYILEGEGKVLCDGAYERVCSGLCHYCPKGHSHSLINDSDADLTFFAVVAAQ